LFNLIKKLTKETELFLSDIRLSDPHTHIFAYSRLREFYPLELIVAKAAPHHGGQPGHSFGR
jgi:hypothetical protein